MTVVHTSGTLIVAVAYILCCRDMVSHLGQKLDVVVVNSPSICMATDHDHYESIVPLEHPIHIHKCAAGISGHPKMSGTKHILDIS